MTVSSTDVLPADDTGAADGKTAVGSDVFVGRRAEVESGVAFDLEAIVGVGGFDVFVA